MDELDLKIVSLLRVDGRLTKLEIARRLGVTEATVRKRMKHLIENDVISVVALAHPYKLGLNLDAFMGVSVDIGQLENVIQSITAMEEVRYAGLATGRYDIIVVAAFSSHEHLADFLANRLAKLPGIIRVETHQIVKVVKRAYEFPQVPGPVQ